MTMTQIDATVDPSTAEKLSAEFNRCFETFEARDDVFALDAFFDMLPPFWRFQLQGPQNFADQLRAISTGQVSVRVLRTVTTATGFVTEHEETHGTDDVEVARRLWLCEVRDGRITEAVGYCNGGWNAELRARHGAEAPMIRP